MTNLGNLRALDMISVGQIAEVLTSITSDVTRDVYVYSGAIVIVSTNGYQVGTLTYVDDDWKFTPVDYGEVIKE
jgi:hypothetical protein